MEWMVFAIISMVAFGMYNFFLKLSSSKINSVLGVVILSIIAATTAAIFLLYLKFSPQQSIQFSWTGIKWAILAGVCAGIAEISFFIMFAKNTPLSLGLPMVMAGTVLVGVLSGLVVLHEGLGITKIIGVILAVSAIALLSI